MNWQSLMQTIIDGYAGLLKENLVGIYLHGSVAFGCATAASDIDFIVVVRSLPSQKQREQMISLLLELERGGPAKGFEMSVVLLADCLNFVYPTPYQLHYSKMYREAARKNLADYCRKMYGTDHDLAAHFTVIRERGKVLYGEEIGRVFEKVPRACYLDSIWKDVSNAKQEIGQNSLYLVLNLCRVWAAFSQGLVLSKTEGAHWVRPLLPERFQGILDQALNASPGGGDLFDDKEELRQFAQWMIHKINALRLKEEAAARYNIRENRTSAEGSCRCMMIGEKWSKIEIYNEYLKKIPNLLSQINTVEKMQLKAQTELEMLKKEEDNFSRQQYQARLLSTMEQCGVRLQEMTEELRLIQGLKEQLEAELDILRAQNK